MVQCPAVRDDVLVPNLSERHKKHPSLVAFGETVRKLRLERGLSQEALAMSAEIDRSYMGGIERGESNITLMSMLRLAEALEVRASEILRLAKL